MLSTNTSDLPASAILSPDGYPFMYIARKLFLAEAKYSNIEKEALAIV